MIPMKTRLDALDGWRVFAVLLVIVQHLVLFSALHARIPAALWVTGDFGHLGVNIFFVISGYVICLALRREYEEHGRISLPAFYIRRCFRILPPLWCYLAVVGLLGVAGVVNTSAAQEGKAAVFVCNLPIANCHNPPVAHTWSLAYEEQFYILFPISLALISVRRRRVFLGFFFILPAIVVLCFFAKRHFAVDYLWRFQFLVTGVVMALFSDEITPHLRRVRPWVVYLCVPAIFAIDYLSHGEPTGMMMLKLGILGPLIGSVLFYTSHFPCAAKSVLSYSGIRFIGRISYGIYLWQQLATLYYAGAGALFYACSLGLMVVICVSSFLWVEQPLIGIGARLSRARIEGEPGGRLVASSSG